MSLTKIAKLTPEQEALIPSIIEKWTRILLSTEPIERQKAEAAVKAAYAVMDKPEPIIRFCSSPNTAKLAIFERQSPSQTAQQLGAPLLMPFSAQLGAQLQKQLETELWQQLHSQVSSQQLQSLLQLRSCSILNYPYCQPVTVMSKP